MNVTGLRCSAPSPRCDMDLFLSVAACFGVEAQHMVAVVVVVVVARLECLRWEGGIIVMRH